MLQVRSLLKAADKSERAIENIKKNLKIILKAENIIIIEYFRKTV